MKKNSMKQAIAITTEGQNMNAQQSFIKKRGKIIGFIFLFFSLVINLQTSVTAATAVEEPTGIESMLNIIGRGLDAVARHPVVRAAGEAVGEGVRTVTNAAANAVASARQTRDQKIQSATEDLQRKLDIINNGYYPVGSHNNWYGRERIANEELRKKAMTVAQKTFEDICAAANEECKKAEESAHKLRDGMNDLMLDAGRQIVKGPSEIAMAKNQSIENRKKDIAINQANNEAWDKRLKDIKVIRNVVLGLGSTALLVFGAKYGTNVLAKYVESIIGKPTLVRETSRLSLYESIFGEKKESRMNEFIVHAAQKNQLMEIAEAAKQAGSRGDELSNVLLYGPPGTGKTMFAKALAHYAGLEYAMMSGSDFSQFKEGEDITELHKLFDWAETSKKGLLVFVDEADAFLLERGLASTSEQSKKLTNAFLSRVEKPSSLKIMWVFATNHPKTIDRAIFSRINDKVEFVLPAAKERTDILTMNIKKYVLSKNIAVAPEVTANMDRLVEKLNGASGRDIEQCAINFVRATRTANTTVVTLAIAEKVIDRYMNELVKQQKREIAIDPIS